MADNRDGGRLTDWGREGRVLQKEKGKEATKETLYASFFCRSPLVCILLAMCGSHLWIADLWIGSTLRLKRLFYKFRELPMGAEKLKFLHFPGQDLGVVQTSGNAMVGGGGRGHVNT